MDREDSLMPDTTERIRPFQIELRLTFFVGGLDIESWRERLPQKVDEIQNRGARSPSRMLPRSGFLGFRSKASNWDSPLEEHWDYLKAAVSGSEEVLEELSLSSEWVVLTLVVDMSEGAPVLILPTAAVSFFSSIRAQVEIDIMTG